MKPSIPDYYNIFFIGLNIVVVIYRFRLFEPNNINVQSRTNSVENKFNQSLEYPMDFIRFPSCLSIKTDMRRKVPFKDYPTGFFIENLWQLFKTTENVEVSFIFMLSNANLLADSEIDISIC